MEIIIWCNITEVYREVKRLVDDMSFMLTLRSIYNKDNNVGSVVLACFGILQYVRV